MDPRACLHGFTRESFSSIVSPVVVKAFTQTHSQGKKKWPSFASVGLRNELRLSLTGAPHLELYNWNAWKKYMTAAASAVHAANPDVLIFFSGLDSDFNIEPAVGGSALQTPGFTFNVASYEYAHKFVFEIHEYDEGISG